MRQKDFYLPGWPTLIRDFRADLGLSVVEFAGVYGVSRASVYVWEAGRVPPPARLTHDVAEWLLRDQAREAARYA